MAETWPSLVAYLEATGLPHRVTSTTGGKHSTNSWHYSGNAIDAAGPIPSEDSPELLAIQHSWLPVADQLKELIGPDPDACVKNGHLHEYDLETLEAHRNHVHTASTVNVVHPEPLEAVMVMTAMLTHPAWGDGYLLIQEDGGVFAYGDAPYLGSVPALEIRLTGLERIISGGPAPDGGGYWLMGGNGAVYAFGSAKYCGGAN